MDPNNEMSRFGGGPLKVCRWFCNLDFLLFFPSMVCFWIDHLGARTCSDPLLALADFVSLPLLFDCPS